MKKQKHKVPLLVKLYHFKNTGFPTILDRLIKKIKPSKKCEEKPGEILFNRNDKIGDALVTIPVLRDLKLNHPSLTIDILCSDTNSFVFEGLDFINKVHIYNINNQQETEARLKAEKYNAIVDLVGVNKKVIRMLKRCSEFFAGARLFGYSWIYDYYLDTNWVSEYDNEPMSRKIEYLLKDCFGFKFEKKDISPQFKKYPACETEKKYDILLHIGSGAIRRLDREIEEELLESLINYNLLITDGDETERYCHYRTKYSSNKNFTFRQYKKLEDMAVDAVDSKIILCYDGGQAHFLGQFSKCIVLVGSLLLKQWAPYDFAPYTIYKKWENGVEAYISGGEMKHVAITYPVWCAPCFNVGCKERPCINNISQKQVLEIIGNSISNGNQR